MSLEPAFEKAKRDMAGIKPYVVAAKSGCHYEGGGFRLAFFNRIFTISYPEVRVEEIGGNPPPMWLQLILLHYLLTADGTPVADQWVTYRHLPGTSLFEQRFTNMAIGSLIKTFGHDLAGFCRAAISLGGTSLSRTGDAAFRFWPCPESPWPASFTLVTKRCHHRSAFSSMLLPPTISPLRIFPLWAAT